MKGLLLVLLFITQRAFALNIVSTSPAITEMVKLIGEEKSLIAVSDYCQSDLPKVGSSLDLNIEKVALLKPDWVIVQKSSSLRVIENLKRAKIKYLELNIERLRDVDESFLKIARLFNKNEKAQTILDQLKSKIPHIKKGHSVVIVLGDDGRGAQWSVASDETLYSDILSELGHRNAYPGEKGKYSLIGPEQILGLNADVFVFLTKNMDTGLFQKKKARIIFMGNEHAQIPSPRIYEFAKVLGDQLK